jgi:hypothetical protein
LHIVGVHLFGICNALGVVGLYDIDSQRNVMLASVELVALL